MNELFRNGKAVKSQATDSLAVRKYAAFCGAVGIPQPGSWILRPLEEDLWFWCTYNADTLNLSPGYISSLLYGLKATFLAFGLNDPLRAIGAATPYPRLWRLMRSIRKKYSKPRRVRKPITVPILRELIQWFRSKAVGILEANADMYCAALALGLYGFLRQGEMTCPHIRDWDPEVHAALENVTLQPGADRFAFEIKASKKDICRWGQSVDLFATGTPDCPVGNMDRYLGQRRHQGPGPLFTHADGTFLTRSRLAKALRTALKGCGYAQNEFSTHSLRRGGCTSMAAAGVSKLQIGYIGRWTSDALERYLEIPEYVRRTAAMRMAAVTHDDVKARGVNGDRSVVEAAFTS